MSKFVAFFSIFLAVSESSEVPTRFRRQYGWGGSPYYNAAQYYETQPQQWSSQYQNSQNYYSPYFYGYQRQQNWQTSNQNTYQSQYNRPSWISENTNGYATAPPNTYNQANSGYARPKYLATMQPKQTLSPVILERSTLFVTAEPMKTTDSDNGRHPTFLERLGAATLPVVPTITSSEEEALEKAEEALKSVEHETLGNGEMLPERPSEKEASEEETRIVSSTTAKSTFTEPPVLEKDEIAASEFFASSTEVSSTSEEPTTTEIEETTQPSQTTIETTTTTEVTTTEPSTTSTTTTRAPATTTMTTTSEPTTTSAKIVKDVKPVTLLAFQEVTNEVTANFMNVTQPTVDQSTSVGDLNEIGEGSGSEAAAATPKVNTSRSTFSTGIVGLRAPPVPKTTDPENVGLAVVEWTDSDNEVKKVLLTQ